MDINQVAVFYFILGICFNSILNMVIATVIFIYLEWKQND